MRRGHSILLACGLLLLAVSLAIVVGTTPLPPWLLVGGIGTVLTESVAYRRPESVRQWFERPRVIGTSTAAATAAIAIGALVAPDRSLSVAIGALGSYCLLLAAAVTDEIWLQSRR